VDVEKRFPFEDGSFDGAVCLNVLEHVFEFENVVSETVRCLKRGSAYVIAVPMLHHIHGSPDDYLRYTESALRRVLTKHDCDVDVVYTLGSGFFSLGFQSVGGAFPTDFIRMSLKRIAVFLDTRLSKMSSKYKKLADRLPLGYFVVAHKL
jgi:SAM-dependent methyltransferase